MKSLTSKALMTNHEKGAATVDREVVMIVADHKITVQEFHIFQLYCQEKSYVKVSEKSGVSLQRIYRMKRQDWWGELLVTFLETKQTKLHIDLADKYDSLRDAVVSVWEGTIEDPKLAGPVVKSLDTISKLGRSHGKAYLEPLQQTKRDLFVDNSVHVDRSVKIDMSKHFHDMSDDEIDKYSKDGIVPERLTVVEADYEDI